MPTRTDLLKDLILMQQRLSSLFEEIPGGFLPGGVTVPQAGCWTPVVDCYESDEKFVITAELAGVSRDDIDLEVRGRKIILSGERKTLQHVPKEHYHRVECPSGKFKRIFEFPSEVDPTHIDARLTSGLLRITLPKKKISTRQIQIESAE